MIMGGHAVAQLVEVLRYKRELTDFHSLVPSEDYF
jgi:hypothetical protein